jgi:parallel beta-helix repeat protein
MRVNCLYVFLLCVAAFFMIRGSAESAQVAAPALTARPGPNPVIGPFYSCLRNYYVASTGNDDGPGTRIRPWRTIQRADKNGRKAGDCINVAAGTYNAGVLIQHGGNAPTPTGYVVYRCQTLDLCHVLANGGGHLWGITKSGSFTVIDGFELDGNNALLSNGVADVCVGSDGDTYGTGNSAHHIWVINNKIHHCNLAGVGLNNKEWYYVLHNLVYHNAYTSGYQGSGIDLVVAQCIERGNPNCASGSTYAGGTGTYTPSGMDLTYAAPFHIVVRGNVVYNNMIAANNPVPCGSHTDGNGIIMDTFLDETTNTIPFPFKTLITGNVVVANGGRGIHVFQTSNVTVANNTAYGNGTDTCINEYYLGDLSQAGGSNNVWINNIAQAVLTVHNPACGPGSFCGGRNAPLVAGSGGFSADTNNSYLHNMFYSGRGVQMFDNDMIYFSCKNNKCNTNSRLVSPFINFALQSTSPAIGYGMAEPYLPPAPLDVGACPKALAACQ